MLERRAANDDDVGKCGTTDDRIGHIAGGLKVIPANPFFGEPPFDIGAELCLLFVDPPDDFIRGVDAAKTVERDERLERGRMQATEVTAGRARQRQGQLQPPIELFIILYVEKDRFHRRAPKTSVLTAS